MTLAAGMYGLTLEKFLISGLSSYTSGLESETLNKTMLVTNAYTPNFDTDAFRSIATSNEPANSGSYTAGGSTLTTTEITAASPAATQLKYTATDLSWTGTTITARGGITYRNVGSSATDEVIVTNIFASDVSTSGGTFTLAWNVNGLFYIDYA